MNERLKHARWIVWIKVVECNVRGGDQSIYEWIRQEVSEADADRSLGFVERVVLLDCGIDLESEFLIDFESDLSAVHEETDDKNDEERQTDEENGGVVLFVNLLLDGLTLLINQVSFDILIVLDSGVFLALFKMFLLFNALADEFFRGFLHF